MGIEGLGAYFLTELAVEPLFLLKLENMNILNAECYPLYLDELSIVSMGGRIEIDNILENFTVLIFLKLLNFAYKIARCKESNYSSAWET